MYRTYSAALLGISMLFFSAAFCVKGAQVDRAAAETFHQIEENQVISLEEEKKDRQDQAVTYETSHHIKQETAASSQRVIDYGKLDSQTYSATQNSARTIHLNSQDYQSLLKIVEAEAGTEDINGKILVANVVMNRVNSEDFPDSVTEVVYQKEKGVAQFSPVSDGRIDSVEVSQETRQAVEKVLCGEDLSQGALYFAARDAASAGNMKWFDTHLDRLFAYGAHEFFR